MKCIFCKENSDNTKSVEHIIPESLGNKTHTLPKGSVCDKCNNYFAVKLENEILSNAYFKSLRHRNDILNKAGNLPTENGILAHPEGRKIEIASSNGNILEVIVPNARLFDLVKDGKVSTLYVPIIPLPKENDPMFSRFIGKVAFEALADKVCAIDDWNRDLVENKGLDNLRNYVRYGKGKFWPYSQRRVYCEDEQFIDLTSKEKPQPYQVLHEYDFLYVDELHLYFYLRHYGCGICDEFSR